MAQLDLDRLPFLRGLPPKTIAAVRRRLRTVSVPAGQVLFEAGDPGATSYLVQRGELTVTLGRSATPLATFGPGAFFGELALLLGEPRSATVVAVTDVELLELSRTDLDDLMASHPMLSAAVSRDLGKRLLSANERIGQVQRARRTVVWPAARLRPLLTHIDEMDTGLKLGAGALPGASLGRARVPAARVRAPGFGGATIGLDAVLVAAPGDFSAPAARAASDADHVVSFGPPPAWLATAAPSRRLVMVSDDAQGLGRAARWSTGRSVGLALSSGGSKTVAHLGVIRALRDAGVEVDACAGSSGGALAATGVATGQSGERLLECVHGLAKATSWRHLDFNVPPRTALFKGRRLRALFGEWAGDRTFATTAIPLWVVAADVATGAEVIIDEGLLADALRASMSLPGAFDPWRMGDRLLLDGAIVNPLPTNVLRDAGVGIVVASNVAGQATEIDVDGRPPGMMQVIGRMINAMEREVIRSLLPLSDVVIRPRVRAASTFDFSNVDDLIAKGFEAANDRLPDIQALLSFSGGRSSAVS